MDMTNGTTKKISRRLEVSGTKNQRESLGGTTGESGITRTNQIIVSGKDSDRGNTPGGYDYDGGTPIGKILQRLELVERSHKDYVRAHQTRLKARLDESENLEKLFCESVEELRQEIYQLATEENESNGNGHH
jgi:hypothetical protein